MFSTFLSRTKSTLFVENQWLFYFKHLQSFNLLMFFRGLFWRNGSQDTHGLHAKIPECHLPEADVAWAEALLGDEQKGLY